MNDSCGKSDLLITTMKYQRIFWFVSSIFPLHETFPDGSGTVSNKNRPAFLQCCTCYIFDLNIDYEENKEKRTKGWYVDKIFLDGASDFAAFRQAIYFYVWPTFWDLALRCFASGAIAFWLVIIWCHLTLSSRTSCELLHGTSQCAA